MTSKTAKELFDDAVQAHKAGDLETAERGYKFLTEVIPKEAEPHYLLGAVLVQRDQPNEAIAPLKKCLSISEAHTPALSALGAALSKTGQHEEAIAAFRKALALNPGDEKTKLNLGRACLAGHEYALGEATLAPIVKHNGLNEDALLLLSSCVAKQHRAEEAANLLLTGLSSGLKTANLYENLLKHLIDSKQFQEAFEHAARAMESWPDNTAILLAYALSASMLEKNDLAQKAFEKLIELKPNSHGNLNKFGSHLFKAGQWKDAERLVRLALDIAPEMPGAISNLGRIRQQRGDLVGARALYEKAIKISPTYPDAHNNLGNLLLFMDDVDASIWHFDKAIELNPRSADMRFNRSFSILNQGKLREAWQDHRLRFEKESPTPERVWPWPNWTGEDITGKKVLLWGEQGIGDQVIHSRSAAAIAEFARESTLECDARLQSLFARSFPNINVCAVEETAPRVHATGPYDFQCSTLDATFLLNSSPSDIPGHPYLKADPHLTKELREKYLNLSNGRPLIGISWWSGWTFHSHFKSTDLDKWVNILDKPQLAFMSLQYGDRDGDIEALRSKRGLSILEDKEINPMGDLDQFAAQVAAMDMVVTISNTTAHIAGALGVPVLNMTPTGPGRLWYWFIEGDKSPWYDSMHIFRHKYDEGWDKVLDNVSKYLDQRIPNLCKAYKNNSI
ncbi:MAG: tetratricopeptide repeat protein [Rhodospirillaceae bacterium]